MEELKELRFNGKSVKLENNRVKGGILPEKTEELNRDIAIEGDTIIEGAVYAHKLEVSKGNLEIQGAVFTQLELYVNTSAQGNITFRKAVGSANSVTSRATDCRIIFASDVNAKQVTLYNAFVAGSIYADEVTLENCVVIGGVFATQQADLTNCIIGTFNAPFVHLSGVCSLLLPSAFSIEKLSVAPGARLFNLSLADLGALYRGVPQSENSGRIEMDTTADELKSSLADADVQKTLRCYSVVGKVLAADLIDTDKFQNHFLLTAASLGPQLLKNYDLGQDASGKAVTLTIEHIRDFFFEILAGRIDIRTIDGHFDVSQLMR
ncbi:MAG: hypothetical protein IJ064_02475 [Bacteroidaceae bacterium]|nr:hypothetical protein [Bacteroidaceae bacterium]